MTGRLRLTMRTLSVILLAVVGQAASASAALGAPEGVPSYGHVVVLVLENEAYDTSWGPTSPALYLNSLRLRGAFADQYYGVGHVSLDNYISILSGIGPEPTAMSDCLTVSLFVCVQPQSAFGSGRNLADQLDQKTLTWKGYMDSMPSPCFHGDYNATSILPDPYQGNSTAPPADSYADRHNPFLYFDDIVSNEARCRAHVVPFAQLARDISRDALPAFAFITPNTCHDGHDSPCADSAPGGLVSADRWLSLTLPSLITYLDRHDGLLLITFDESANSDVSGCCAGGPGGGAGFGGRVGLLALSPRIRAGAVIHTPYDHASLLRTIEDVFGIEEHLNNASSSRPMADLLMSGPSGTSGVAPRPSTTLPNTGDRGAPDLAIPALPTGALIAIMAFPRTRRRTARALGWRFRRVA